MEENIQTELQKHIKNWLENYKILQNKRLEIKEINSNQKELEEIIINKMNLLNINTVNLSSGGKIQRTVKKSKRNLKKNELIDNIYTFLNNNELSDNLIKSLEDAKPSVEKEKISLKK